MKVRIGVMFSEVKAENEAELKSIGNSLTNDRESVQIVADENDPRWLFVEFAIKKQRQIDVVDRIDRNLGFQMLDRQDSVVGFPKDELHPTQKEEHGQRD